MPDPTLWAAPQVPRTLTVRLDWTPEDPDSSYRLTVGVAVSKGGAYKEHSYAWPEGSVDHLPHAVADVVVAMIRGNSEQDVHITARQRWNLSLTGPPE